MIDPLPSDIFRAGQILNNTYEIEGILGRGGTGEVYRARNKITGRVVAIKALNSQFSGNADYLELMKREEEMRNILHDAVVRYTDCSLTDDGHVFLVMDFIDGPSLNDLMLSGRVDARDLLIVDDLGLRPLRDDDPLGVYDPIRGRYERGSMILTSNRAIEGWLPIFRDPQLSSAAKDRLPHRAHVVEIEGKSHRTGAAVAAGRAQATLQRAALSGSVGA
jgi:hypothetical protein